MKQFILTLIFSFCLMSAIDAAFAQTTAAHVPESKTEITLSFAPLVKQVTPAVVNIYTQKLVEQRVSPLFNDPFFRQFFGSDMPQGMARQRMENSLGSGVLVRADGLIVTSRHVIADADEIRVVLSDHREFDAKVVMTDEHADLALLHVDAKDVVFPYLELRDSDDAEVGDLVLAIGNPFGVGQTVTSGIISALSHYSLGSNQYDYFIQTDAAINPGNSGGALVTLDGKLVGINAAIYSRDGGNMGIGFAVPSNLVRSLLSAAKQGKGEVVHPWLGLKGQEITGDIARSLGLPQPTGVLVKSLHHASPAAKAGLRVGDVITAVNGRDVSDPTAFLYRVATLPIDSVATFDVLRGGQKMQMHVDMIVPPEVPSRDETTIAGRNPVAGAVIGNLSPALAETLGLDDDEQGVVVLRVKDHTLASQIGLQAGDIIRRVNDAKLEDVAGAVEAFKRPTGAWHLTVRRNGNDITVAIRE